MEAGIITLDGIKIGVIEVTLSDEATFTPDLQGYEPMGRADSPPAAARGGGSGEGGGKASPGHGQRHSPGHGPGKGHGRPSHGATESHHRNELTHHDHEMAPRSDRPIAPEGKTYSGDQGGQTYRQGSAETDEAIVRASKEHGLDPNFMRSIAGIESSMDPSSNANRATQYKGLYQIGRDEWRRVGQGNIYSAHDNAQAAARLFKENSRQFENKFGRKPTDTEMYLMHQQGLGFYTRGAMTNIQGNLPGSERGKPQTHESFEAVWGRKVAAGKAAAARAHGETVAEKPATDKPAMPTQTEPM